MRINMLQTVSILTAALLSMAGCAEFVYNSMHSERVAECEALHGQEQEECLVQAQKSYEKYEAERKEEIRRPGQP